WLALHLGRKFMMLLLYPVAFYFLLTASSARHASRQYLERALGRKPGWLDVWRHFYTFAVVSVDRLFFLSGCYDKYQIQVNGNALFQQYLKRKQGCILLVSHFGSFEVMRVAAVKKYNIPVRILLDRQHSALAAELIDALDPVLAAAIIDPNQSAPELALSLDQAIKNGELIGIMADRAGPDERMLNCEFLGGQANFPVGPWLLALILKAPVILCFGLYQGGNRYQLNFELLTERLSAPRRERDTEILRAMQHYASRLEHHIGMAPYNWFNFYEFWLDETTTNN
ncbi:MAG: lipid A biosynthesis acyltransferase, partial [Thiohalomonadales bacterium]